MLEILNQAPTYQLVHQTLHDLMMHQGGELHHTSGKEEGDFLYLSPDNLHGDKPDRSKTMYSNFLKLNTVEPHHHLRSPWGQNKATAIVERFKQESVH